MRHTRIVVTHYGGPEALRTLQEECPEPKRGQVRVRVLAAGVSLPDLMMREGIHPETPRAPFTPGWDLVGVASHRGERERAWERGIEENKALLIRFVQSAARGISCFGGPF